MPWPTRVCGARTASVVAALVVAATVMQAQERKYKVPTAPPEQGKVQEFRDAKYGVRFNVPAGWTLIRRDHQVSTFRLDARTAASKSEMRAVAALDFNPFPISTFSGALFYFSVAKHVSDADCAAQASDKAVVTTDVAAKSDKPVEQIQTKTHELQARVHATQNIGGMDFVHGHDEHGGICVEARDEVYTAYRKGSCYRFDLAVNTFCSVSSGAPDLSRAELRSIEAQMAGILSSVSLDWEKSGPRAVAVPEPPEVDPVPASPKKAAPAMGGGA